MKVESNFRKIKHGLNQMDEAMEELSRAFPGPADHTHIETIKDTIRRAKSHIAYWEVYLKKTARLT